jgi:hypothetical protein
VPILVDVPGDGNCGIYSLAHNLKIAIDAGIFDEEGRGEAGNGGGSDESYITKLCEAYNAIHRTSIANNTDFKSYIKDLTFPELEKELAPVLRSLIPHAVTAWDSRVDEDNKIFPLNNVSDKQSEINKQIRDKTPVDARVLAALACYLGFATLFNTPVGAYSESELKRISEFSCNEVHGRKLINWQPYFIGNHFQYQLLEDDAGQHAKIIETIQQQRAAEIQRLAQIQQIQDRTETQTKTENPFMAGIYEIFQLLPESLKDNNSFIGDMLGFVLKAFGFIEKIVDHFEKPKPDNALQLSPEELKKPGAKAFMKSLESLTSLTPNHKKALIAQWRKDRDAAELVLAEHCLKIGHEHLNQAQAIIHKKLEQLEQAVTKGKINKLKPALAGKVRTSIQNLIKREEELLSQQSKTSEQLYTAYLDNRSELCPALEAELQSEEKQLKLVLEKEIELIGHHRTYTQQYELYVQSNSSTPITGVEPLLPSFESDRHREVEGVFENEIRHAFRPTLNCRG